LTISIALQISGGVVVGGGGRIFLKLKVEKLKSYFSVWI